MFFNYNLWNMFLNFSFSRVKDYKRMNSSGIIMRCTRYKILYYFRICLELHAIVFQYPSGGRFSFLRNRISNFSSITLCQEMFVIKYQNLSFSIETIDVPIYFVNKECEKISACN